MDQETTTIADVLDRTNRWNVVVPGTFAHFPDTCICCGSDAEDWVKVESSKTITVDSDFSTSTTSATVANRYAVCRFCSDHFRIYKSRAFWTSVLLFVPVLLAIVAVLAWVLVFFESSNTAVCKLCLWLASISTLAACVAYFVNRHYQSFWNRSASGLKESCRSSLCPVEIELSTSPEDWLTFEDRTNPHSVSKNVNVQDGSPDTRLFIWVSGFSDMASYAQELASLNPGSEVVRAVVDGDPVTSFVVRR